MGRRKIILLAVVLLANTLAATAKDDTGLILGVAVEKKFNKKTSIEVEADFRSRNDFRTVDRFSVGITADHKITKWLKADLGYQLLVNNRPEKITYNPDGNYNNWRPSYYCTSHRFNVSLTGSYRIGRVDLSLRERYRYTYRPLRTTRRYDFDNAYWENTDVLSKHSHVLRSRLKAAWDIPKCKFKPYVSAELFNDLKLFKSRYQAGCEYSLMKKHEFTLYYQYQYVNDKKEEEDEPNSHMLGLSYKFKF